MRLLNKLNLLGRSALCLVFVAGTTALTSTEAAAASFTFDFCPSTECTGDNLTQATLEFTETVDAADPTDLNDYILELTLAGTGTDTIDQVSFTLGGVQTPGGYESRPVVQNPTPDGLAWSVFYDNVANAGSCLADGGSQEVCANSTGNGPTVDGTQTWTWFVDLDNDLGVIGVGSSANLRAHFLTAAGGPGGNFSPSGNVISTTSVTTVITTDSDLPEPTLLTLLGAGLAGVSLRLRRRKAKA